MPTAEFPDAPAFEDTIPVDDEPPTHGAAVDLSNAPAWEDTEPIDDEPAQAPVDLSQAPAFEDTIDADAPFELPPSGPTGPTAGNIAEDAAYRLPAAIASSSADATAGLLKMADDASRIPARMAIDAQRAEASESLQKARDEMGTPEGTEAYREYMLRRKTANEMAAELKAGKGKGVIAESAEFMRDVSERAADDYLVDRSRDDTLPAKVVSGLGSVVPALASGPLAPVTVSGMMAESGLKDAEAHGATDRQKEDAFYGNAAVGVLSEALLGIPALLRSAKAAGLGADTFEALAKAVAWQTVKGSIREGIQEGLEQTASNTIANAIAGYDPERRTFQDVPESAFIGAIVGGGVGAGVQAAQSASEVGARPQIAEPTAEQKLAALQAEAERLMSESPAVIIEQAERMFAQTEDLTPEEMLAEVSDPLEMTTDFADVIEPAELEQNEAFAGDQEEEAPLPQSAAPQGELSPDPVAPAEGQAIAPNANAESETLQTSGPVSNVLTLEEWAQENRPEALVQIEREKAAGNNAGANDILRRIRRDYEESEPTTATAILPSTPGASPLPVGGVTAGVNAGQAASTGSPGATAARGDVLPPELTNEFASILSNTEAAIETLRQKNGGITVPQIDELRRVLQNQLDAIRNDQDAERTGSPVSGPFYEAAGAEVQGGRRASKEVDAGGNEESDSGGEASGRTAPRDPASQLREPEAAGSSAAPAVSASTPPAQPPPPPASRRSASAGPSGSPSGISNARIDAEREARGLPPIMSAGRRTWGSLWTEAMEILDRDRNAATNLVAELVEDPRPTTDLENTLLGHEKLVRRHAYDNAIIAQNTATDDVSAMDAAARLERARNAYDEIDNVLRSTGTESGRGLASRKQLRNDDFTLAQMEAETRAAQRGKPLSEKQAKDIAKLHKEITAAHARIAELEAKEAQRDAEVAFAALLKEQKKEAVESAKRGKSYIEFVESFEAKALARIEARRGRLLSTIDPLNLAGLLDESIVGAAHLARGISKFADWSAKMIADLGERIRPVLPELFKKSQEFHETNTRLFALNAGPTPAEVLATVQPGDGIDPKTIFDLARAHVRNGMKEMEEVMTTIHRELSPLIEGVTLREIRDAFSGYGKTTFPSKEADLVALREMKALARLTSQLEDARKGAAPLKTGPQRDKPTEKVRTLQKQVSDTMRKLGITTTSPEQQLRTSLDAVKTRMRNEIEELDAAISNRAPRPKGKAAFAYDAEAKALKAQRDAKRKEYDAVFDDTKHREQQAIDAAIATAKRSIARFDEMLRTGNLSPAQRAILPANDELEALQSERDAMRAALDELRRAEVPRRPPEERFREKAVAALEKSIALYDQKLRTGDIAAEARASKPVPDDVEALRSMRDAMRRQLLELRKQASTKPAAQRAEENAVRALEKSIAEYDRRLQEGDFTPRATTTNQATPTVQAMRAERDVMRKLYEELRRAQTPKRSPEEVRLARDKAMIANRIAKIQARISAGDYSAPAKSPPVTDAEKTRLLFEYEKKKGEFNRGVFEAKLRNRTAGGKLWDSFKETLNTSRAVMTSVDFSGVLRQGGVIVLSHPYRSAKALPDMFRAFGLTPGSTLAASKAAARQLLKGKPLRAIVDSAKTLSEFGKQMQFAINEEIRNRPNAALYKQAKLFIAEDDTTSLSAMEEAYMGRWSSKIPGIGASQRAYVAFLNRLRADSFDAAVATLSANGNVTKEEAAAIATYVNMSTGRGNLGKLTAAAEFLNTIFFAPRYVVSRFQFLLNPVTGFSITGGSARVRGLIASEYARYLAGVGVVLGLAALASSADDETPELEIDPRSSDFMKVRFGDTRLDVFSGLLQATVFAGKQVAGSVKNKDGDIIPIRGDVPYGKDNSYDVATGFLRTKFAPAFGAFWDLQTGRNVIGEKVTPSNVLFTLSTPMSAGEVAETMQAQGVVKGTALGLGAAFGFGVQNHKPIEDEEED